MKRPTRLTQGFCERVAAAGFYSDGSQGYGLRLRVHASGKSWVQSYRGPDGKQRSRGLGAFPGVSLDRARWVALSHAIAAKTGADPREGIGAAHGAVSGASVDGSGPTFADVGRDYIAMVGKGWKPGSGARRKWEGTVAKVAFRNKPVDAISREEIRAEILPIWSKKPTVARLRLVHIRRVLDFADVEPNPADGLREKLPRRNGKTAHYDALPHADVPGAVQKIRAQGEKRLARVETSLALEFVILTATRQNEALNARWEHVEGDVWIIPAENAKTGWEHRVPLSRAALAVLDRARALTGGKGWIFPGRTGKPMGRSTLRKVLKVQKIDGTAHGFRSSFRDWCGEQGVAREVAEAALAHTVGGVEGAYARSDLLERRRPVMEDYGRYITS